MVCGKSQIFRGTPRGVHCPVVPSLRIGCRSQGEDGELEASRGFGRGSCLSIPHRRADRGARGQPVRHVSWLFPPWMLELSLARPIPIRSAQWPRRLECVVPSAVSTWGGLC